MSLFSDLRSLAFQRRIARALERIADAQETLARLALEEDERRAMKGYRPRPKRMEIGMFSQAAASRNWRQSQIDAGVATTEELDEEYGPIPEEH